MFVFCLSKVAKKVYFLRYKVYTTVGVLTALVYLLYRWNFVCFNVEAWHHVQKICRQYEKDLAQGTLCSPLCEAKQVSSFTCYSSKEAGFSATWRDTRLVFKSASSSDVQTLKSSKKYPTEKEFLQTITTIVKNSLNVSVSKEVARRLTHLRSTYHHQTYEQRLTEMNNIWVLLQDNEYLLTVVHSDKDVFPQVLGTCGNYFALEYVEPVRGSFSLWQDTDTRDEWGHRLKAAILILELVEELEGSFHEPLHLCDIDLAHFGFTRTATRAKFIDVNGVYPKSVVDKIIGDVGACETDEDCEFFDCRGRCNRKIGRCDPFVSNNNLQIVCEKVFLGWRMSNRVLIPGLLMSEFSPMELMSAVRQCANPEGEIGLPRAAPIEDTRKQLYEILIDVEQRVNANWEL